jgi:urea carboxylase
LAEGQVGVESHIAGNLWQVVVQIGQQVTAGESLVILESMKMEIEIQAPVDGVVAEIRVSPGSPVKAGQCVVVINEA